MAGAGVSVTPLVSWTSVSAPRAIGLAMPRMTRPIRSGKMALRTNRRVPFRPIRIRFDVLTVSTPLPVDAMPSDGILRRRGAAGNRGRPHGNPRGPVRMPEITGCDSDAGGDDRRRHTNGANRHKWGAFI